MRRLVFVVFLMILTLVAVQVWAVSQEANGVNPQSQQRTLITLTGRIVYGHDNPHPVVNAYIGFYDNVSWNGDDVSGSDGSFIVPNVPGNTHYYYRIITNHYQDLTGIVVVDTVDVNMGELVQRIDPVPVMFASASTIPGPEAVITWETNNDVIPTCFRVWRLPENATSDPNPWELLTPSPISAKTLHDSSWHTISSGAYRYAVQVIYPDNGASSIVFTNAVTAQPLGVISGRVTAADTGQPIGNAYIESGTCSTFSNSQGYFDLTQFCGSFTLECSAARYHSVQFTTLQVQPYPAVTTIPIVLQPADLSFEDSFENATDFSLSIPGWITYDFDQAPTSTLADANFTNEGAPMAFMVFNPSATTPPLPCAEAHTGNKYVICFPRMSSPSAPNDDLLITPVITAGDSAYVSFWARAFRADREERFRIGVAQQNVQPLNFIMKDAIYTVTDTTWQVYNFALGEYAHQAIRIAIHCISAQGAGLLIDDVQVSYSHMTGNNESVQGMIGVELIGNHPNPFGTTTTIDYNVKEQMPVVLEVFTIRGQKIRTLLNQSQTKGSHQLIWNGKDDAGRFVANGVYLYRLTAGKSTLTRKMIRLK